MGQQLKEMIAHESVTFYVSPFLRSRQTYDQLRMCFHDEQVCVCVCVCVCVASWHGVGAEQTWPRPLLQVLYYREDPRLREQEWGNLQDPDKMEDIRRQRRQTGAFYFRFPTGERCWSGCAQ